MSKSLELTITDYSDGPWDLFGPHFNRHRADQIAARKRLMEAELCAEFESMRCDLMMLTFTGNYWSSPFDTCPTDEIAVRNRVDTMLRFATTPHYFEQD